MATLLIIIPIKQLSGYSYWHTVWRIVAALIPFFVLLGLLIKITWFLIPIGFRRLGGIY